MKPTQAAEAFKAFLYVMKNRRLISFTGIFAKVRQELKYSDFENILTDDSEKENKPITYELYKWDITGGFYRFTQKYILEG